MKEKNRQPSQLDNFMTFGYDLKITIVKGFKLSWKDGKVVFS